MREKQRALQSGLWLREHVRDIRESRVMTGPAGGKVPGHWEEAAQMAMLQGSRAERPKAKTWDSFI